MCLSSEFEWLNNECCKEINWVLTASRTANSCNGKPYKQIYLVKGKFLFMINAVSYRDF